MWYPSEPELLGASVDRYLHEARLPDLPGTVIGVLAPHAGHRYSGPVAGYAFACLRDISVEIVAVLSPMHYPYPQPVLTSGHAAYRTPLGTIPVDRETLKALDEELIERLGFGLAPVRNDPEHALEIELPFLQRALPSVFRLLPIMIRDQSPAVARAIGGSLGKVLSGRKALLVASSDLSHFYNQAIAESLDDEILRRIAAFDPAGVLQAEEQGLGFACGRGAIAATLWSARELGADTVKILKHSTSGEATGDYEKVVGYAAAAILRSDASNKPHAPILS
jgi:AmmeMemoRadiSam system protein B